MAVLALLKLGFRYGEILGMPEEEAEGFLEAWRSIVKPEKRQTYRVRRPGKGRTR